MKPSQSHTFLKQSDTLKHGTKVKKPKAAKPEIQPLDPGQAAALLKAADLAVEKTNGLGLKGYFAAQLASNQKFNLRDASRPYKTSPDTLITNFALQRLTMKMPDTAVYNALVDYVKAGGTWTGSDTQLTNKAGGVVHLGRDLVQDDRGHEGLGLGEGLGHGRPDLVAQDLRHAAEQLVSTEHSCHLPIYHV